jgi:hypothetical protein
MAELDLEVHTWNNSESIILVRGWDFFGLVYEPVSLGP